MNFLLKMSLFIGIVIYAIYAFVGVETIIKYSGEIWFGVLIILFIVGLIIKIIPQIIDMLEEKFVVFIFFIIIFAISVIIAKSFDEEILNKKTLIVFNFDNTARYILVNNKEYVLKPNSHKTIIARGKYIHIDDLTILSNGKYLVNISKNFCYKIEPINFLSKFDISKVENLLNPYENIITKKIIYYNKDKFLVFKNEKFDYSKDKKRYSLIMPVLCKDKVY